MLIRRAVKRFRRHQLEAWRTAQREDELPLIWEMRLGKTLFIIRWAERRTYLGRVLVVAPLSVFVSWEDELRSEGIRVTSLVGSSKQKAKQFRESKNRWFLVNPEGLRAWSDLAAYSWDGVIADESTFMMNATSKITKVMVNRFNHVLVRACLTGTLMPNGPENAFCQIRFVHGSFMGKSNFYDWRHRYMTQLPHRGWRCRRGVQAKVKKALRDVAYLKTAKQAGVFVPKVRERRFVNPPASLMKLYRQIATTYELGDAETKWELVAINWRRQLAGGTIPKEHRTDGKPRFFPFKVDELVKLLGGELKGKAVVVWFQYTREIKNVRNRLRETGIDCSVIQGRTPLSERRSIVRKFGTRGNKTLLCQGRCARFGLNFSRGSTMVFYSNDGPLTLSQCEKRMDHLDKTEPTLIIDLIAKGTIDHPIVQTLKRKQLSSREFMQEVLIRCQKQETSW